MMVTQNRQPQKGINPGNKGPSQPQDVENPRPVDGEGRNREDQQEADVDDDKQAEHGEAPAFRDGEQPGPEGADVQVRPAGPEGMADSPGSWDDVDEAIDESFPASDPPSYSPRPRDTSRDTGSRPDAATPDNQGGGKEEAKEGRKLPGADGPLGAGAEEDNNP